MKFGNGGWKKDCSCTLPLRVIVVLEGENACMAHPLQWDPSLAAYGVPPQPTWNASQGVTNSLPKLKLLPLMMSALSLSKNYATGANWNAQILLFTSLWSSCRTTVISSMEERTVEIILVCFDKSLTQSVGRGTCGYLDSCRCVSDWGVGFIGSFHNFCTRFYSEYISFRDFYILQLFIVFL